MAADEQVSAEAGPASGRAAPWKQILGYALAVACLVWVFHDVHVERMLEHMGSVSWWWVLPAVVCDILGYVSDGVRWRMLLMPVGRLQVLRATQAIYISLFANEVMPMRFGELVRAYLAGRWMGRPVSMVVPSLLVCRLLDAVWLAAGIGLVALSMPLPGDLMLAGDIFGFVVLVLAGVFLVLVLREPRALSRWAGQPSGGGITASFKRVAGRVLLGLQQLGAWRTLSLAGGVSLLFLAFEVLAFWLIMQAYQLRLPLSAGAAIYLIVRLGTALPNAPANVGSYQFFTVLGLSLFGVEKTRATGFSIVVFIILTLPLWVLGLMALSRSGLTLAAIREDLRSTLVSKGGE